MRIFSHWLWFFVICCFGICFLVSCSKDKKQEYLLLDSSREEKLLDTEEWKAFDESWLMYLKHLKTPKGNFEARAKQKVYLLKECLAKIEKLKKFENEGLISNMELTAMRDLCNYGMKHAYDPQVFFGGLEDKDNKMRAYLGERSYKVLKERVTLLKNLLQQNNWLSWIKHDYVFYFIKSRLNKIKASTDKSLQYWDKPVTMDEINRMEQEISSIVNTIRQEDNTPPK